MQALQNLIPSSTPSSQEKSPPTKKKELSLEDHSKAIVSGLAKLERDPKYAQLPPEKKVEVRGHLYDKFVSPYFKRQGLKTDDTVKNNWINTGNYIPDLSTGQKAGVLGAKLSLGGLETVDKVVKLHEKLSDATIGKFFPGLYKKEKEAYKQITDYTSKLRATDEQYLGDHYYSGLGLKIAGGTAELVGKEGPKLPIYAGVGEAFKLGEGLLKGSSIAKLAEDAGPASKFLYRSLKRYAEGYLMERATGGSHQESKESGEFFGFLGATGELAGGAKKLIAKMLGIGGTKLATDAVKVASQPEAAKLVELKSNGGLPYTPKKLTDYITAANADFLNQEAKRLGAPNFWMAKPGIKVYALNSWAKEAEKAAQHVLIENPEIVEAHVGADLALERKASPALNEGIAALEKLNGQKGQQLITSRIIQDEKAKVVKVDKQAALKVQSKLMKDIIDKMSTIGPGAASKNEQAIRNKLIHVVESNIGLQGRANQLTFAWSVNQYLPKEIRTALAQEMKEIYGPSMSKWDGAANALDKHINKLIRTGHITPNDLRGVFRSTRLIGEPTKWQQMLDQELKDLEIKRKGK